ADDAGLTRAEPARVGLPGFPEPARVADVLADRERVVDAVAGELCRLARVVLRDELRGALLERGAILGRPPVVEAAVAVEPRALVVEAVADLVADDRVDRAVVGRRIPVLVEERVLQDRRREIGRAHV